MNYKIDVALAAFGLGLATAVVINDFCPQPHYWTWIMPIPAAILAVRSLMRRKAAN